MNQTANAGSGNALAQAFDELGASVGAVGALQTYFDELASVAPAPIEDDAEIVAKAYDQETSDAGSEFSNPLGSLGDALMTSMTSSYQLNAMNEFAIKNCGHGV